MKILIVFLIISLIVLTGCEFEEQAGLIMKNRVDKSIQACIDIGGAPIISSWDSHMADCIFPEQTTQSGGSTNE